VNLYKDKYDILVYYSVFPEVNTERVIEFLYSDARRVYLPKIINNEIYPARFTGFKNLVKGKYNIMEPEEKYLDKLVVLELLIVPGVAFDLKGNRLGRGKGYFDRFLKRNKEGLRVAFSYDFQVIENVPVDENDEKVNYIITEKRVIEVREE